MLNREKLINAIADISVESAGIESIIEFYRDAQVDYMEQLSNTDLIAYVEAYIVNFTKEQYKLKEPQC